jgi:4-carboxymuconolactone decarboxylase
MNQLPKVTPDTLTPEQEVCWGYVLEARRKSFPEPPKAILGPYIAWLQFPVLGRAAAEMGDILRTDHLPGDLREIAIFAAAMWWKSDYLFQAHARGYGHLEGLDAGILAALKAGEDPPFRRELQRLVHSAAVHLLTDGDMPRPLRDRLVEDLGWPAIVQLVAAVGFYSFVAFTINVFDIAEAEGRLVRGE